MLSEDQRMQMMYTGLANCFCYERSLAWSRSQLLTVINVTALPLFITTTSVELRYLVGIAGVIINFFWYWSVNRRSRRRINYWQECLAKMEPPEAYLLTRVFTGPKSKVISTQPFFYAVNLLPWMLFSIWLVAIWNTRFPGVVTHFFNLLRSWGIL